MAVPDLIATPGAPNANSYVTLAEADAYVAALAGPSARAWEQLDDDAKKRALLTATRRLDQEEYAGRKASSTQALKWPRVGVKDEDGRPYPSDVIPEPIKAAQIEIALGYGDGAEDPFAAGDLDAYKRVQVGPIEVEMRDSSPVPGALPDQVRRLLAHLLVGSAVTFQLVRS